MAKSIHDSVFDAALNVIKTTADRIVLCSAEPANYAGVAAVSLADIAVDSTDFTGPANGDVSGRKLTCTAQNGVDVDTTGTGNHVACVDDGGSVLLYVTTCANVNVDAAGTVDIASHKCEIADPT